MGLVYSVYALATNLIASGVVNSDSTLRKVLTSGVSYVSLSLGSKQMNPTDVNKNSYLIQCWIGLGMVVVWMIVIFMLKYFEAASEFKVEE